MSNRFDPTDEALVERIVERAERAVVELAVMRQEEEAGVVLAATLTQSLLEKSKVG